MNNLTMEEMIQNVSLEYLGQEKRMCYCAAMRLYNRLFLAGYEVNPIEGLYDGYSHWWLEWENNGTLYIIDVTARQFDTSLPSVIFAPNYTLPLYKYEEY